MTAGPSCNGAYVTFIQKDEYVPLAGCLEDQLAHVNSTCRFVVMYDSLSLSQSAKAALQNRFDNASLVELSSLFQRLNSSNSAFRGQEKFYRKANHTSSSSFFYGRRLYASLEYFTPWLKLWLWALPFQSVIYLDADVLVLRNLDHIFADMASSEHAEVAAVPTTCHTPLGDLTAFNAGVMWLRPSLRRLRDLQALAADWYKRMGTGWKPNKACEQRVSDQTILYAYLILRTRRRPMRLPASFNVPAMDWAAMDSSNASTAAIVHYVGEPKPWHWPADTPKAKLPPRLQGSHFGLWHRRACPALSPVRA